MPLPMVLIADQPSDREKKRERGTNLKKDYRPYISSISHANSES